MKMVEISPGLFEVHHNHQDVLGMAQKPSISPEFKKTVMEITRSKTIFEELFAKIDLDDTYDNRLRRYEMIFCEEHRRK